MRQVVNVTLSEIEDEVDQVVGRWRSQTSTEQRNDLSYLDDLLGETRQRRHRLSRDHRRNGR